MKLSTGKLEYYFHIVGELERYLDRLECKQISDNEKMLCEREVERYRHILDSMNHEWLFD